MRNVYDGNSSLTFATGTYLTGNYLILIFRGNYLALIGTYPLLYCSVKASYCEYLIILFTTPTPTSKL